MFTVHNGTKDGYRSDCKKCFYASRQRNVKVADSTPKTDPKLQELILLITTTASDTMIDKICTQTCTEAVKQYFTNRYHTDTIQEFPINIYKLKIAERNYMHVKTHVISKFMLFMAESGHVNKEVSVTQSKNFSSSGMLTVNVSPGITPCEVAAFERSVYVTDRKHHSVKVNLESLDLKKIFAIRNLTQNYLQDMFFRNDQILITIHIKINHLLLVWNESYGISTDDKKNLKSEITGFIFLHA